MCAPGRGRSRRALPTAYRHRPIGSQQRKVRPANQIALVSIADGLGFDVSYALSPRGPIEVKGKGEMTTWFLDQKRS